MDNTGFKPKQALLIARIIYSALIAGLLFFLGVTMYISKGSFYFKADLKDPLLITLLILSLIVLPAGSYISRMVLPKPDSKESFQNKFPDYLKRLIIRMATCEGIGLYAIICFMLNQNLVFLLFLLIALLIMLPYYPTPDKIGSEINLNQSEIESFT
jgi:hypothetical protein